MYRKILVPFDNSSLALSAVEHAIKLALVSRASVTLFHVAQNIPVISNDERNEERLGSDGSVLLRDAKSNMRSMLEKLKESFAEQDVKIDTAVTVGNPAREIVKKAKIEGYDLIVMGSRGLGKIPGILLGSVSNKVCRGAPCPVIVIHAN